MTEHGLVFTTDSIRGILAGTKTQTRRVIAPQPEHGIYPCAYAKSGWAYRRADDSCSCRNITCPYGGPGDLIWVKEAWGVHRMYDRIKPSELPVGLPVVYRCDLARACLERGRWRSSRLMVKWAARIWLEILSVRPERVQEITEEDAIAEGVRHVLEGGGTYAGREGPGSLVTPWLTAKEAFSDLWDSLHAKAGYGWEKNPYVWRIEFKRVKR